MLVPLFKQRPGTCGPTALRMVLAYCGSDVKQAHIIECAGGLTKFGVKTVKLYEVAKEIGYYAECFSYNRRLSGGKAKIKKPTLAMLDTYLKRGVPPIIAVRTALLYNNRSLRGAGHFIVITEHKNDTFYYNDPFGGKRRHISEEDLRFAWYNNTLDSSAYLLAIWPKK